MKQLAEEHNEMLALQGKVSTAISIALRLAIGGVFVYAGILKAMDPTTFARDIENYRILPHAASVALSLYLPYVEIFCGLGVILKRLYAGSLLLIGAMMLVFIGALISAWARDLNISCGCFGTHSGRPDYPLAVLRDVAILACAGFLVWHESRRAASSASQNWK
jgi:putative oxidoreductase